MKSWSLPWRRVMVSWTASCWCVCRLDLTWRTLHGKARLGSLRGDAQVYCSLTKAFLPFGHAKSVGVDGEHPEWRFCYVVRLMRPHRAGLAHKRRSAVQVLDVLYVDGECLVSRPLSARRETARRIITTRPTVVQLAEHWLPPWGNSAPAPGVNAVGTHRVVCLGRMALKELHRHGRPIRLPLWRLVSSDPLIAARRALSSKCSRLDIFQPVVRRHG